MATLNLITGLRDADAAPLDSATAYRKDGTSPYCNKPYRMMIGKRIGAAGAIAWLAVAADAFAQASNPALDPLTHTLVADHGKATLKGPVSAGGAGNHYGDPIVNLRMETNSLPEHGLANLPLIVDLLLDPPLTFEQQRAMLPSAQQDDKNLPVVTVTCQSVKIFKAALKSNPSKTFGATGKAEHCTVDNISSGS